MDSLFELEENLAIDSAWIRRGFLDITIRNHLPLHSDFDLNIPGLTDPSGTHFVRHYSLFPGEQESYRSSLNGYLVITERIGFDRCLSYEIVGTVNSQGTLATVNSMDSVTSLVEFSEIVFEEVIGPFGPVRLTVPETVRDFDVPDLGTDIQFKADAHVVLEISNTVNIGAGLDDLIIYGESPSGRRVDLEFYEPLSVSGAPHPGDTEVTILDIGPDNSNILDFLGNVPGQIGIGGEITLGDGTCTGTIRSMDFVFGEITFTSPLTCSLGVDTVTATPHWAEIRSAREFMGTHLESVAVTLVPENHLPLGVEFAVSFGEDSAGTYESPFLRLPKEGGYFVVSAGRVGAKGTVVQSTVDTLVIELESEEAKRFDREDAYVGVELHIPGTRGTVTVLASDYVHVGGRVELVLRMGH
jgi:RNase P/RNase MRP subunit p29